MVCTSPEAAQKTIIDFVEDFAANGTLAGAAAQDSLADLENCNRPCILAWLTSAP